MEVFPKARQFMLRVCTSTLPVRRMLHFRHMVDDDTCLWCNRVETVGHALFDYERVRDLWADSGCEATCRWEEAGSMCDLVESWGSLNAKLLQKGVLLAWGIWQERNQKIFEGKTTPNDELLNRVVRWTEGVGSYSRRIYTSAKRVPASGKSWKSPPEGIVKLNMDASLAKEGWVGLGVIARDAAGRVLYAATRRMRAHWPSEIAEAQVIDMALKIGKQRGLGDVLSNRIAKCL
ncbi:uncharacterized protein LOC110734786 [Chenopodium quinoa]|uniref:uncharacterized protein LOC110734786 n=1 Tax=Chenopodium quinoa TaxID=63459 RepID=UPI000B78B81F|nr:uncharacterized protein LOC110734786 [Chenopodium quinoa]